MGGLFKSSVPKMPKIETPKIEKPKIPTPPKPVRLPTGDTQKERELAIAAQRRRRGYLSTILTEGGTMGSGTGLGG